jgi:hypothetical protein
MRFVNTGMLDTCLRWMIFHFLLSSRESSSPFAWVLQWSGPNHLKYWDLPSRAYVLSWTALGCFVEGCVKANNKNSGQTKEEIRSNREKHKKYCVQRYPKLVKNWYVNFFTQTFPTSCSVQKCVTSIIGHRVLGIW